jgi:hypothetical protein
VAPSRQSPPHFDFIRLIRLQNEEDATKEDRTDDLPLGDLLPPEILAQTGSFPLSFILPPHSQTPEEHLRLLLAFVPPEQDAIRLRDAAYSSAFFL